MVDLAVREEDHTTADSLFRKRFPDGRVPLSRRGMLAYVRGDTAMRSALFTDAREAGHPEIWAAARDIALYFGDFATADSLARLATAAQRQPSLRAPGHFLRAELELACGRWDTAKAEFAAAERLHPAAALPAFAFSAASSVLPVPRSDLELLRERIRDWDPAAEPASTDTELARELRPHLRLYLLGLLSARLGEDRDAGEYAAELERLPVPGVARAVVAGLSATIRADVAYRRGQTAEALALLEPVGAEIPSDLLNLPFYSGEHARYLRAELLYQLGRDEQALRWFTHSFIGTPHELVYRAPAHLRSAELHERLGNAGEAADQYARFLELWDAAGPELQPLVERTRRRLAALAAEPARS